MNDFYEKVYTVAAKIPRGFVTTYGNIARAIGYPNQPRRVGYAMNAAPDDRGNGSLPPIPCHRVVNRLGELCADDVFGGEQRKMLEDEGVTFLENGRIDMKKHLWFPDSV